MLASCWTWDVNPVLLPIAGPIQIRWYGLSFLALFYFGWKMLDWQMRRGGHGPDVAARFINWSVVAALLGSWFGHRLFYEWDKVVSNPLYLIDIRGGIAGLSSHGGSLGMMTIFFLFGRKYRIPIGEMFDRAMWGCASAATFIRLGNFFNSEVVGLPTDLPWAVCLPRYDSAHNITPSIGRHPSQLYEALVGIGVMLLLTLVDRLAGGEKRPRWLITGTLFVSYFTARFFVEMVKEQQGGIAETWTITTGALLSVPFVLFGIGALIYAFKMRLPASGGPSLLDAPLVPAAPAPAKGARRK